MKKRVDGEYVVLLYLPIVVMHEFGHTAGLSDLYEYPDDRDRYLGSIMMSPQDTKEITSIPDFDKEYIKQVYRNEHGAKPHVTPSPSPR